MEVKGGKVNIGIIADGNGRWAERRGLPRIEGHEAGAKNIERVVTALKGKTDYLVLFGFSTENWNRPSQEVKYLFRIMEEHVNGDLLKRCLLENIRLYHFGDRKNLPCGLLDAIDKAACSTSKNEEMHVGFCLNYGARDEIKRAASKFDSTRDFSCYLDTYPFPDVDLIIRTGGEHRLSNFLLYQSAYAELYFTDTLFPDLEEKELDAVISWYKSRIRKFGK